MAAWAEQLGAAAAGAQLTGLRAKRRPGLLWKSWHFSVRLCQPGGRCSFCSLCGAGGVAQGQVGGGRSCGWDLPSVPYTLALPSPTQLLEGGACISRSCEFLAETAVVTYSNESG